MIVLKYLIAFIVLSVVILFHELGHFLFAKKNDIKVNEFSLGLGPTLFGFQKGETKYSVKALPFGGACIMEGEDDESSDSRSFQSKSVWARISVVFGGPLFNFIMAFICAVIMLGSFGYVKPELSSVMNGYPAQEAGLRSGDEITSIDGRSVHFYKEVTLYTMMHPGKQIRVSYKRGEKNYTTTITPKYSQKEGRYLMGFTSDGRMTKTGSFGTMKNAALEVKYWIQYTFGSLKMLVTRQVSVKQMTGPVGLVKSMGDSIATSGPNALKYSVLNILIFIILLSANLGVLNLLPLPALDGGRLLFLIIELIRRKRIPQDKEAVVHFIGIVLLFALMIVIMFQDIVRLFKG